MKKQATYPTHLSFIERLAKKVITRVVSDGLPLDNAIKEAVHVTKLNTQQIFHLCAVLEDRGQVFNGDEKNYFYTATDMGKEFPNTQNGYVVYASENKNAKNEMETIFKTVTALKKQGFTDKDILKINNELAEVLAVMNEFNADYKTLVAELDSAQNTMSQAPAQPQQPQKNWLEKGKDWMGQQVSKIAPQPGLSPVPANMNGKKITAADEFGKDGAEKATPMNVNNLKAQPQGDLEVDEDSVPAGDLEVPEDVDLDGDMEVDENEGMGGGEVNAPIKPSTDDFMKRVESAPKWEVKNVLSMQMAESYYKAIQKDFDALMNNPNIDWSKSSAAIAQYEKVRAAIEGGLNKISEAQKGAESIEKKENKLEQQYQTPEEAPTDQLIAENPIEEEPIQPAQGNGSFEVPENEL